MQLNQSSAMLLTWTVKVLHGKVVKYSYNDNKTKVQVNASKFLCYLVSDKPGEYVQAVVRHSSRDPNFVTKQAAHFVNGTVWKMSNVHFNAASLYNGARNKVVVLLESPTKMIPVLAGSAEYQKVSSFIQPDVRLADVMQVTATRFVDVCFYVQSCEVPRQAVTGGVNTPVATALVRDETATAEISCWNGMAGSMNKLAGKAVVAFNVQATMLPAGIKLHLREDNSIVVHDGSMERLRLLAEVEKTTKTDVLSVTVAWTPSVKPIDVQGFATLGCCALINLVKGRPELDGDQALQMMGVVVHASLNAIHTSDGKRLFLTAQLHDWSGSCTASFVESGIIELTESANKEDVEKKAADGTLRVCGRMVNLRGVIRGNDFFVASVSNPEPFMLPSQNAMFISEVASLCGPLKEGILPAAHRFVRSDAFVNLGVKYGEGQPVLGPHGVTMLVQGTEKTTLVTASGNKAARILDSKHVVCLMAEASAAPCKFQLRSFCHEDDLMDYTLHTQAALIRVTSVLSRSASDETPLVDVVYVVERLDVVEKNMIPTAIAYMKKMFELASVQRLPVDPEGIEKLITPSKKARTLAGWPSDQGNAGSPSAGVA